MSENSNIIFSEVEELIEEEEGFYENELQENNIETVERHSKKRRSVKDLRQARGKFSLRWERAFPWVRADNIHESLGICTVCNKQLVCKKSHLERHEKSYKHQRMLAGIQRSNNDDIEESRNKAKDLEYFDGSSSKLGWSDEEVEEATIDNSEFETEYCEDIEVKAIAKEEYNIDEFNGSTQSTDEHMNEHEQREVRSKPYKKINRQALLKRIDRSRSKLHNYYSSRQADESLTTNVMMPPTRDSFDLFFDSVSASVKTLPPKLAAEVKSRVSQLIAEFELRAICEREAAMANAESIVPYSILPTKQHVLQETSDSGIPRLVYTFQPKDL